MARRKESTRTSIHITTNSKRRGRNAQTEVTKIETKDINRNIIDRIIIMAIITILKRTFRILIISKVLYMQIECSKEAITTTMITNRVIGEGMIIILTMKRAACICIITIAIAMVVGIRRMI